MYDLEFRYQGDFVEMGDRLIEWYVKRGRDCLAGCTSHGKGCATIESLLEAYELERDLGITVVSVKRVESSELVAA